MQRAGGDPGVGEPPDGGNVRWFGYVKRAPESDYPSELNEATVAADPATLRAMAHFLNRAADLMEKHGDDFEHSHFERSFPRPDGECRFVVNRAVEGPRDPDENDIRKEMKGPHNQTDK